MMQNKNSLRIVVVDDHELVETHRAHIMMKMGLHSLLELIHYAIRDKIITTQDL